MKHLFVDSFFNRMIWWEGAEFGSCYNCHLSDGTSHVTTGTHQAQYKAQSTLGNEWNDCKGGTARSLQ